MPMPPFSQWCSRARLSSALLAAPMHVWAAADGAHISTQGAAGVPACITCHGAKGEGNPEAGFPRLAGLSVTYFVEQLDAMANGARVSPVMQATAQALKPEERRAVAQYYASLPLMLNIDKLAATALQTPTPAETGAWLALRGAWDKNIPACNQCHGPGGISVGEHFPPLAGQSATYIANQLRAWQQGRRPPGPLALMPAVASGLSEAEINAVSAYYADLPKTADALAAQHPPLNEGRP